MDSPCLSKNFRLIWLKDINHVLIKFNRKKTWSTIFIWLISFKGIKDDRLQNVSQLKPQLTTITQYHKIDINSILIHVSICIMIYFKLLNLHRSLAAFLGFFSIRIVSCLFLSKAIMASSSRSPGFTPCNVTNLQQLLNFKCKYECQWLIRCLSYLCGLTLDAIYQLKTSRPSVATSNIITA